MSEIPKIAAAAVEPDEETVAVMRALLKSAESGELRCLAYVGLEMNQQTRFGIVGREHRHGLLRCAGLLHWLANKALSDWDSSHAEEAPETTPD